MDLMTLAAKIVLDDSDYRQGVKNAEASGRNLANKMSAMTVAVGQLAADMAKKAIAGVRNIVESSIGGYADYQQLIGGVETLFRNSASKISKYAEQSYKSTGLSANQYMETVTSFSASLLQGLKGDTETAAEMANMAVTDMADNANKMGTDISSIQNAYQGFAKQNYTMLDNLKLGYGGTASEMVRLVNDSKILDHEIENLDDITFDQLVQAIHEIQKEMGITGTTAKEAADTISGSKNSLKAAWADLLVTVAGTDQGDATAYNDPLNEALKNFETSFTTYVKNIVPTIVNSLANSGDLILGIADAVASLPEDLLTKVTGEIPDLATDAVTGLTKISHWLVVNLANAMQHAADNADDIREFGDAVGKFIAQGIKDAINYLPEMIMNALTIGNALAGGIIEGLTDSLFGPNSEVEKITDDLQDKLTDIELDDASIGSLISSLQELYDKYGAGAKRTEEWKNAQEELEKYLPGAGTIFTQYGNDIQGAIDKLNEMKESMRENAIIAGMEKALAEEKELYGEQKTRQTKATLAAESAESKRKTLQEYLGESSVAYAQEILDLNAKGANFYMDDRIGGILANAEKTLIEGTSDNINDLIDALENYYEMANVSENDTVWGRSKIDKVYDPQTVEKYEQDIETQKRIVEEQTAIAEEAGRQAKLTWEEIELTTEAMTRDMKQRSENHASDLKTADDKVIEETTKFANTLNNINYSMDSRFSGGGSGGNEIQEDTGIDWVPTNGFRASLHRGEAVLTKAENEKRLSGAGSAEIVGAIQGLRQDMQNLKLMVGRKTFGRAVVDYGGQGVNDYIGGSNSRDAAGYGT